MMQVYSTNNLYFVFCKKGVDKIAVIGALFDISFAVLQRYNRPRVVRLIAKKY